MDIRLRKTLRNLAALVTASTLAFTAGAFPTKPIRILVTSAAGANLDVLTRLLGEQMSKTLGQTVIVENVTGAGGLIALRQVSRQAAADGYTLVAASNTVVLLPAFKKDPGYDPVKDLVGIGDMQTVAYLLVGPAGQPQKTLAELIAAAKANPGALSFANGGIGTSTHLPALMLAQQAGIEVAHVPYRGNANALPDVVGGRTNALWDAAGTSMPMVKEGKLRVYGVSSKQRIPQYPDLPTMAEQGLPNYDFKAYLGILAPAGTPAGVVKLLNEALRAATKSEAMRDFYQKSGSQPGTMTAEEFTAFIKRDAVDAAKIVSDLKIEKD